MFKVKGQDGKEYGPVDAAQLRSWLQQNRLHAQSLLKLEGTDTWKPLAEWPELRSNPVPTSASAPPPLSTPAAPLAGPKTSGMAVASLVLGILAVPTFGLTGLFGLVLGIVALIKINRNQGQLRGTGFAIAGMSISGMMLLMLPIMAAMLLPALAKAKSRAQQISCMNNVKQLNLALIMYAQDNQGKFPPADRWCDLIKQYTAGSTAAFHCRSEPGSDCSYAYNAALANVNTADLKNPTQTVLVFSSDPGWNKSGGLQTARPHHHGNVIMAGFADGHAETTRESRLSTANWER